MSMITELVNRLREAAMVMGGDSNTSKLFREAADTIETLSEKVRTANMDRSTAYYREEVEAYQKAFKDIKAEIRQKAGIEIVNGCVMVREYEVEAIIDKHNPDKVGKERE